MACVGTFATLTGNAQSKERNSLVDFVAHGTSPDEWIMVLVEEGPWLDSINDQLRRLQERLYGCIDAALDGHLAAMFPESKGKHVVVQLDCYNLPQDEVQAFSTGSHQGCLPIENYADALRKSPFVKSIAFKLDAQDRL